MLVHHVTHPLYTCICPQAHTHPDTGVMCAHPCSHTWCHGSPWRESETPDSGPCSAIKLLLWTWADPTADFSFFV